MNPQKMLLSEQPEKRREYEKRRYLKHKDRRNALSLAYYYANKEIRTRQIKTWRENNPENCSAAKERRNAKIAELRKLNPVIRVRIKPSIEELEKRAEHRRLKDMEWWQKNKERVRPLRAAYQRKIRSLHPNQRILDSLRRRLNTLIRSEGRQERARQLLGCTLDDFRKHIQSLFADGMSWENYGRTTWHLDHKRPCSSFDLTDPLQRQQCFHFTNMQPLWAKDNLTKHAKWQAA